MKKRREYSNRKKEFITNLVCEYFENSIEEIRNKYRSGDSATIRQTLCYLLKNNTNMPYHAIAEVVGVKKHETAMYAVKTAIPDRMFTDSDWKKHIKYLQEVIDDKFSIEISEEEIKQTIKDSVLKYLLDKNKKKKRKFNWLKK